MPNPKAHYDPADPSRCLMTMGTSDIGCYQCYRDRDHVGKASCAIDPDNDAAARAAARGQV